LRNKLNKAKRRSTYQSDRIRMRFNYSDSKPFVQTHFGIGKYLGSRDFFLASKILLLFFIRTTLF